MGKLPADWKPHHEPYHIDTNRKKEALEKKVIAAINDGLPVQDAFILAGIPKDTYMRWKRECVEDIQNGYTGTHLISLMMNVAKADKQLYRGLSKAMFKKANEGDTRLMMYLADNRFGNANKRKNTLELEAREQNNVQINIIDMKSIETEVTEDNEEIEVYGVSRDDSDSTEMDQ